ncbi:MAG: hypothetical protein FJX47_20925, partial [Alphaproteobacteria bacterium]|nr:hypothetical protein [Alphaproteobacteria bacterium]
MLRPPADGLVAGSHTTAASMAAYERLGGRFAVASDLEFSLTVSRWRRAVAGIRRRGRVIEKIGRALGSFHVGSGEPFPRGATLGRIATIESEEGIDSLCLEAFPDTPIGVIRSREYLAWRYARAPFADSLFSVIRRSSQGRLVGLAILQVNADGARIAVAEALAAPEE